MGFLVGTARVGLKLNTQLQLSISAQSHQTRSSATKALGRSHVLDNTRLGTEEPADPLLQDATPFAMDHQQQLARSVSDDKLANLLDRGTAVEAVQIDHRIWLRGLASLIESTRPRTCHLLRRQA